ncbi:MAG: ABC transporter permease [Fibrobacteres bacterium]|nr:ABC transporter permease [Fibrobacterota bacterium]
MTFTKFALSNLKRNKVRSFLTALSLVVSAATLTIVLSLDRGYGAAVQNDLVDKTGIHLYVTKEGCPIEAASVIAQGGLSPLYVSEDVVAKLRTMPEIDVVFAFQLFSITTSDGSRTDIFMGVDENVAKVKPDWQYASGGFFENDSSVILGAEMARLEQRKVGEKIFVEAYNREFTISGILKRSYSQDDGMIFMPLHVAQQLVDRVGKLSAVAAKLKDVSNLNRTRNNIRAMLPNDYFVIGSKELSDGIMQFFASTRVIMFAMVGIAFLISVFGIINTMLMAILERKKEIAYLKCVGAEKNDLLHLIALETGIISIAGSAIGTIIGLILSPVFGNMLRKYLVAYVPSGSIADPTLAIVLLSFFACTIVGILCSLYPAYRASRIVPMEVLRNE